MGQRVITRRLSGRALAAALTGVAILAVVAVLGVALARDSGGNRLLVSDGEQRPAPAFALPTFGGERFSLANHAEGPVFIYFWASWCRPCEVEAPMIQRLWEELRGQGYTFVGVNIWDLERDARAFAQDHGLTFPLVRDPGSVSVAYGVERLPMAVFLRPGLQIDRRVLGELREQELRELLTRLRERA